MNRLTNGKTLLVERYERDMRHAPAFLWHHQPCLELINCVLASLYEGESAGRSFRRLDNNLFFKKSFMAKLSSWKSGTIQIWHSWTCLACWKCFVCLMLMHRWPARPCLKALRPDLQTDQRTIVEDQGRIWKQKRDLQIFSSNSQLTALVIGGS